MNTDVALSNICIPRDAIMCSDVGCKDISHGKSLYAMYDCIVEALYEASKSCCRYKTEKGITISQDGKKLCQHTIQQLRRLFGMGTGGQTQKWACPRVYARLMPDINMLSGTLTSMNRGLIYKHCVHTKECVRYVLHKLLYLK